MRDCSLCLHLAGKQSSPHLHRLVCVCLFLSRREAGHQIIEVAYHRCSATRLCQTSINPQPPEKPHSQQRLNSSITILQKHGQTTVVVLIITPYQRQTFVAEYLLELLKRNRVIYLLTDYLSSLDATDAQIWEQ